MARNAVLALVVAALGWATASGQGPWAEKMFRQAGNTTSHDFGSVPRGAQLFHRFTVNNIYAVSLEIMSTRSSCGCVTITPSARVVKPRESASIDVLMDARRFTGPKTVSIHVAVGPEYTSTAVLQVSANSRADVVFNPGEISFGVVQRGQTPNQTIDVEYAGTLDWRVTGVDKNNAPLDVAFEELYRRPGQVGYRVRVTLRADAPAGTFKWELFLKTNDPASPLVPVLVEATVQAPLAVVPGTLSLGNLKVGEEVVKKVVVRSAGKPFRILTIEGAGDGITAELPPAEARETHAVTIKCRPKQSGELRRQLHFKTDLDKEATATVMIEWNAVP